MSDTPNPRSYPQIVGEMVDALLARLGLPALKVGSPALSIIEAAAQSDFRASQDIFGLLNSMSLDRATGQALKRIGDDEGVVQIGRTAATGTLTIGDSSFTKISSNIYQGAAAPIIGTTALKVKDATLFPATGLVYIGRNTANYEGPLAYSAKVNSGSYWTLTLSTGTTKFHNLGESVVLAQGGNRTIGVNTIARTSQGNAGTAVQFATTFAAVIPDGEVEIQNVPAAAREAGSIGNVVAGSVVEFVSAPFAGATVTNPGPFTNGYDTEEDNSYRERIKQAKQSRTRGTALAIQSGVVGLTAPDENNRILSASVVTKAGEPASLYIDDGTGYEEKTEGIAYEVLTDSAVGGEQYFQLAHGRPVTKAFVQSSLSAPFNLTELSRLAVEVGGVLTTHAFRASEFRSIDNASAFEVAAAINSDPVLLWTARTSASGTKVVLTAKGSTNEQIQVVAPEVGQTDANLALGFTTQLADSLWLYKDDVRLNKDGRVATLLTKPNTSWSAISSGATLNISVDGIALTITFNDSDFVDAGTPYVVVSQANDLVSWAKVFNLKIPGVTATVSGSSLMLTSNKGRSGSASIQIAGGTMAVAMFSDVSAVGADQDYSLDRNLGQIKLNVALLPGERLTAGSFSTRSFVESNEISSTLNVAAEATSVTGDSGAEFWLVVDGSSALVPTLVGPGTSLQVTLNASPVWGKRVRVESGTGASIFGSVRAGDWMIATDSGFNVANRGAYRVVRTATTAPFSWVEIEQPAAWASTQVAFAAVNGGLKFIRTTAIPQRVFLSTASNPYTPSTLAAAIQSQIRGATASTYRTNRVRVRTNTFVNGDLAVVAANVGGVNLGFPIATPETSGISHLASATTQQTQRGTPSFTTYTLSTVTSPTVVDYGSGTAPSSGAIIEALKTTPESSGDTNPRWGNDNFFTTIVSQTGTALTLREAVIKQWLPQQRLMASSPYAISARDSLGIVLDDDEVTKRYTMNMYRRVKPTTNTYGAANFMTDADNSNVSLAQAFGVGFNWTDFAVHMKARAKANGILWRYFRHGPEGNYAGVSYTYPTQANSAVSLGVTNATVSSYITIGLASGAARSIVSLRNTSYVGIARTATDAPNDLSTYTYVFNLPVATGSREIRLGYQTGAGARTGVVTGATSGATATTVSDGGTYVVVTGVAGTFFVGEALTWGGGGTATSTTSQYGHTTLNLTTPGSIGHGLVVGNPVWLQSTDVNFTTGAKVLTAVTSTSISYNDSATTTAAIAGVLSISRDIAGEVSLSGSGAVAGDLLSVNGSAFKTLTLANDNVTLQGPGAGVLSGNIFWFATNPTALTMFPLNAAANSTSAIVTAVNALNGAVTGFESTPGTVSWATYEAPPNGLGNNNSGIGPIYMLKDGINFVRSTNTPVLATDNFEFTFKDAVDGTLAASADWINEDVRLVPITAANVVRYLNSAAVGGLFSGAEIVASVQGAAAQITTVTGGSAGSVRAVGGTANSTTAAVVGNASIVGTSAIASVVSTEAEGLVGDSWVSLDNAIPAPKTVVDSTTTLTALDGTGLLHTGTTKLWKYPQDTGVGLTAGQNWHVEKQGAFVAYVYNGGGTPNGFTFLREGDWVAVDPKAADSTYATNGTMNSLNRGLFRVVRTEVSTNTFWVENPNAIEENATVDVIFLDYDSVLPADTLVINTPLWGTDNIGSWKITRINTANQFQCYLDISTGAPVGATAAALGASSGLVQVYESAPGRLIKQIQSIVPNGTTVDVRFSTSAGYSKINAGYGTVISALDKLEFLTTAAVPGVDGYTHSRGLIEEANRVVYGDEAQSSTYPGIAAAGASIDIGGPLVRRVTASLALRVRSGVSLIDIRDQVRSAVAAVINETDVGASIAISDLVAAAQSVNGVVAVTVLSPVYGTGSDLIAVQPYEKPLVNDVQQDIQISFVGD